MTSKCRCASPRCTICWARYLSRSTSTGAVDRLHVSTVSDFFGRLFLVSCTGRGAVVHRGEPRVRQDHERTMMISLVTSGHSIFHHDNCVPDAGRGDVVAYCSTKPYSATFDDVAKHTFMLDYSALGLPDHVAEGPTRSDHQYRSCVGPHRFPLPRRPRLPRALSARSRQTSTRTADDRSAARIVHLDSRRRNPCARTTSRNPGSAHSRVLQDAHQRPRAEYHPGSPRTRHLRALCLPHLVQVRHFTC